MKGFIGKEKLDKIDKITSNYSRIAVWIVIITIIIGSFSILVFSINEGDVLSRLILTTITLALAVAFSASNIRRLRKDDMAVQILALIGTIMNAVWAVSWSILIWIDPTFMDDSSSILYVIAVVTTSMAWLGWFGAILMDIKEYDKDQLIRPLKYTATAIHVYLCIYCAIFTVKTYYHINLNERFLMLTGFVSSIHAILLIAILIMSRAAKKKIKKTEYEKYLESKKMTSEKKTDSQLRDEIREQVRREMIEEEIRKEMEKK